VTVSPDEPEEESSCLDVSIVVPTLGRPQQAAALSHVLDQLQPHMLEALFVFQDEVDRSTFLALRPASSASALLADQRSAGYARNWGLVRAKGAVVAFLDDDCRPVRRDWLRVLTAPLAHPGNCLATGAVAGWATASGRVPGIKKAFQLWPPFLEPIGHPDSAVASFCDTVAGGNFAGRTADLVALGGFSGAFGSPSLYEETELSIRVTRATGGRIRYVPDAAVRHEQQELGGMRTGSREFNASFVDSQRWVLLREVYGDRLDTHARFLAYRAVRGIARFLRSAR
jgi:GT2 family glycosyltransferase